MFGWCLYGLEMGLDEIYVGKYPGKIFRNFWSPGLVCFFNWNNFKDLVIFGCGVLAQRC